MEDEQLLSASWAAHKSSIDDSGLLERDAVSVQVITDIWRHYERSKLRNSRPWPWRHIPHNLKFQQYRCENLRYSQDGNKSF
jgi:hypothetical protein